MSQKWHLIMTADGQVFEETGPHSMSISAEESAPGAPTVSPQSEAVADAISTAFPDEFWTVEQDAKGNTRVTVFFEGGPKIYDGRF